MARGKNLLVIYVLLLCGNAWAGVQQDYEAGRDAWRRGDVRAAISGLRNSADSGHAPSQSLLGEILDRSEQNEEAVRYFRLAAAQGDAEGHYGLAVMQASGEGTARDTKLARESMTRAATLGHKPAVNALAVSYMQGGLGLAPADRESPEALRWIDAASANDLLAAIDRLAVAYRKGEFGLAVDVTRAAAFEARATAIRGAPAKITKKRSRSNG